jgi:hypothetical protein
MPIFVPTIALVAIGSSGIFCGRLFTQTLRTGKTDVRLGGAMLRLCDAVPNRPTSTSILAKVLLPGCYTQRKAFKQTCGC